MDLLFRQKQHLNAVLSFIYFPTMYFYTVKVHQPSLAIQDVQQAWIAIREDLM